VTHSYASKSYAETLFHMGRSVDVPEWGSYVIARSIPGGLGEDIIGCYPLSILRPDADISAGLVRLRNAGFVSATLILDDFHRPSTDVLESTFDLVRPFKTHFLHRGPLSNYKPGRDHRYKINRAYRTVATKTINLVDHIDGWIALYDGLTERHNLSGMHVFPRDCYEMLARIPGIHTIGGFIGEEMVSCHIWVVHKGRVHSHLTASSALGYTNRAAYAVSDTSIKYFADAELINFGGGAGLGADANDGLTQFKRGFSNDQAKSYICGSVLDRAAYERLSHKKEVSRDEYFPAYRNPVLATQAIP
jgi:hypothetical protein